MNPGDQSMHRINLSAKALKLAINNVRIAFPKKRQEEFVVVAFAAKPGAVVIRLPGASVEVPCTTYGEFTATIPFLEFRQLAANYVGGREEIDLGFSHGKMSVGDICINCPEIRVSPGPPTMPLAAATIGQPNATANSPQVATVGPVHDLETPIGFVGFPLLSAYEQMRRYPDPTLVINTCSAAIQARHKVNDLLDKIGRMLRPLGLGRLDIEKLLDERLGLHK